MIPTTDPRTSAIPQGTQRARPVQPLGRPGGARQPDTAHVEQLSAMVAYLRSLQEHYGADRRVNDRIRDAAVRVQALVHALRSAAGDESAPGHAPSATWSATPPAVGDLETAFVDWLADPVFANELRLDGCDGPPTPMRQVLDALCSSVRALPAEAAATLGMPAGTTIGHAASELRLAVEHPAGPRCRTYRAAAYYLRGLDRLAVATAEAERTPR